MPRRLAALTLAAVMAGCGQGASSSSIPAIPTDPPPPSAAPPPPSPVAGVEVVDRCLVGTWVSSGATYTTNLGGLVVSMTGGAGERLTIGRDGGYTDDGRRAQALTGSAGLHTYSLGAPGVVAGEASTGPPGVLTLIPAAAARGERTLFRDGVALGSLRSPISTSTAYSCAVGGGGFTLTTVQGVVTVFARP